MQVMFLVQQANPMSDAWQEIIEIDSDNDVPYVYSELSGPESAFQVRENRGRSYVKVVDRDAITVDTFWRA